MLIHCLYASMFVCGRQANVSSVMNDPGLTARERRAEQRGLKRSLNSEDQPKPNYTVYTYVPSLCDKVLRGENQEVPLPNVQCSGCRATFAQKSITDYAGPDEVSREMYADLQFHQFGALCLPCRAPFPGEGHFEERNVRDKNPLTECLENCLGVVSLQNIVLEYYKHPEYTLLENLHFEMLMKDELEDEGRNYAKRELVTLYSKGRRYMSIPGVEHVYYRGDVEHYNLSGYESVPDIKLDYRYWRPKECKCTRTPCECICFPVQVFNIMRKLKISNTHPHHDYKILVTRGNANYTVGKCVNYRSFFVYLRDWSAPNPSEYSGAMARFEGVCQTKYYQKNVVTVHTAECCRRSAQFLSFKCMLHESRCGQCEACVEEYYY